MALRFPAFLLLLGAAGYPFSAWAVLGEATSSIERDRSALHGILSSVTSPSYHTYVITASDVVLKEFVAPDGRVFAVYWSGRRPPHLGNLLGTYFEEYRQTLAAALHGPKRRGGMRTESARVVVETGGHSGDIRGRAYVPALMPADVRIDDLQ